MTQPRTDPDRAFTDGPFTDRAFTDTPYADTPYADGPSAGRSYTDRATTDRPVRGGRHAAVDDLEDDLSDQSEIPSAGWFPSSDPTRSPEPIHAVTWAQPTEPVTDPDALDAADQDPAGRPSGQAEPRGDQGPHGDAGARAPEAAVGAVGGGAPETAAAAGATPVGSADPALGEPVVGASLVDTLREFASEHGVASCSIEYLGRRGARITITGLDELQVDYPAAGTDIARSACAEAGVHVENSWERELLDQLGPEDDRGRRAGRRFLTR